LPFRCSLYGSEPHPCRVHSSGPARGSPGETRLTLVRPGRPGAWAPRAPRVLHVLAVDVGTPRLPSGSFRDRSRTALVH
jgi:hypothetical protein